MRDARDFFGDTLRGKHEVDALRGDCIARHPVVLGALVLRESDAADCLDLAQPHRAVAAGARQNYAYRNAALILRHRFEKKIDWMIQANFLARLEPESLAVDDYRLARR